MTEYIERGEAVELLLQPITMSMCLSVEECHHKIAQRRIDRYLIEGIPAADVRPAVRGKWVGNKRHQSCSECHMTYCVPDGQDGELDMTAYHFCPNCGADMREVDDVL